MKGNPFIGFGFTMKLGDVTTLSYNDNSPPPLKVLEKLRSGVSLDQLIEEHKLVIGRSTKYPNLVQLNYHQFESSKSDPIASECRGLILDEGNNWKVIARPFTRFFNYGEPEAAKIEWSTVQVYEKLDGSLCIMYWYDNQWQVATRGSPDAGGNVGTSGIVFSDLFWETFHSTCCAFPDTSYKGHTFLFELCCPENKIVVNHTERKLYLLDVISKSNGLTIPYPEYIHAPTIGSPSYEDIIKSFEGKSAYNLEGYVVRDEKDNRVKIKLPQYVKIHKMKDKLTPRGVIEMLRAGETDEFLTYFPEYKTKVEMLNHRMHYLLQVLDGAFEGVEHIESQKEFALAIQGLEFKSALFAKRNGKVDNFYDFIWSYASVDTVLEMLDEAFPEETE